MDAKLLYRFREVYGPGIIEGVIWEVPYPVLPSEHRVKYRLVFVVHGNRLVGYDNERGKGDHKHIMGQQFPYIFRDVATLVQDFILDVKGVQ
ncbi:toxin-antitoxin system TumE family protein [Acidithiobacillus concretivorus]|jgi:hypothetical protein|uniref:Uncharacterized protein n=1 Tax=Acidithiobacillus concretivorus TaxID=3063952 RepID=A0ABS5ZQC3_9PROT|nr:DUF6516 family protein [Acidithiobacillus concretivorus]MBU2738695.1 hypothetical protein [Acidithiobacillus concretivorus]